MKKIALILLHMFVIMVNAQVYHVYKNFRYNSGNTNSIKVILSYTLDNGYYQKITNFYGGEIEAKQITEYYAYNKKKNEVYVRTLNGNYVIELRDEDAKYYKNRVPNYKEKEIIVKVDKVNEELTTYYEKKNAEIRCQEEQRLAKAREDSIKKAKEDSIRIEEEANLRKTYKKTKDYREIPVNKENLYCIFCEKTIPISDKIYGIAANNDSICWFDMEEGDMGLSYLQIHKAAISSNLKKYKPFKMHYEIFSDSLNNELMDTEFLRSRNNMQFYDYINKLKQKAPNGYFKDWGWNDEYSNISFHFRYMNTNKNTIKYIEVFFVVKNDVGDVRKTGSFRGTGPLGEGESASWNWDHSSYYVAGDASEMNISKVIITYMNGSKVTIPKNKLRFN